MRKLLISFSFIIISLISYAQDAALTSNKIIENGKEYYLYTVHESEGFMAIGRKFGVSYKDIIDANKEASENGLRVGQIIRVPVVEGRNASNKEIDSDHFFYHKVDSGETVFFISHQYGVALKDIYDNNPGSDEVLSIGQELKIPKQTNKTARSLHTDVDSQPVAVAKNDSFQYHTVQPQETAHGIARKYHLSLEALVAANPGLETNNIAIGTKLRIPNKDISKPAPSKELKDTQYTYHRIKTEETLEDIAEFYNIPVEVIKNSNNIDTQIPPAGYMLKIPHSYEFKVEVASENQETYIVKKKDDIRTIAENYQVPIMDIQAANPHIKKWTRLKKNTKLIIPTLSVESVDSLVIRNQENQKKDSLLHYFENRKNDLGDTLNIAFIWPLYLQLNDTVNVIKKENPQTKEITYKTRNPKIIYPESPIFREFYFGALIALNDLKTKGVHIKIKNYDAERGVANVLRVLKDSSLANADIIIGPGFNNQVDSVSDFCLKHHIRLVLPFPSDSKSLEENPFIYQVFPTTTIEYAYTAKEIAKRYGNANIILVKGKNGDKRETLFADLLKSELYNPDTLLNNEISYKEISYTNDRMSGLSALLRNDMQNLIIIPAKKEKLYSLVVPVMENFSSKHEDIDIKLLGFDEWQNFKGSELENLFNVECEIYTPLYANLYSENSSIKAFKDKYTNYLLTLPTEKYPYYGMLGYDVTNYFIKGLCIYGNHLEKNLQNIKQNGLCVNFDFERINNWGGFVNKNIYTIEYTKDFEIRLVK